VTAWNGGDDPEEPVWDTANFRDDIDPAEPPPVTEAMITPQTAPKVPEAAPASGDVACRVCGEHAAAASYCLACGVSLVPTTQPTEPLPWEDSAPEPDFDDGLLDLEDMDEVVPLRPSEGEPEKPPSRLAASQITGRHIVMGLVTLAALILLYVTFRPASGEDAAPATTVTAVDPSALSTYGSGVLSVAATVARLRTDAATVNADWDSRAQDFETTLTDLSAIDSSAAALPDLIAALEAPDIVGTATHQRMLSSAETVAAAASEMVEGLKAPDHGEARTAALAKFDAAAGEFASLAVLINQTVDSVTTPAG